MMGQLLSAEWLRIRSRRLVWVIIAVVLVATVLQALSYAESVAPISDQDRQEAQEQFEENERWEEQYEAECEADPMCEPDDSSEELTVDDFLRLTMSYDEYLSAQLDFGGSYLLLMAIFTLTVITIGSDFGTGALTTQLTFTPRRLAVMFAKLCTSVGAAVAMAASVLAVGLGTSTLVYLSLRGPQDIWITSYVTDRLASVLVATLLVAIAAGCFTFLVGSTVVTLVLSGVIILGSAILESSLGWPLWKFHLLPTGNMQAVVDGEYTYWFVDAPLSITAAQGVSYWVVVIVVLAALASWQFRRRDLLN